uniref:Uncharacterized protein n=1 Tax=Siphoviridae sp. ctlXU33 TaxID=2823598 RepID=A0A8S5LFJ5_9CAUD|nr:MAG TPA: hypothetical protein [Siphoviridae sp. ctlXU33]
MFASLCPKAFAISVATAHHSPSFSTNLISWLHHFSIFIKSPPNFLFVKTTTSAYFYLFQFTFCHNI